MNTNKVELMGKAILRLWQIHPEWRGKFEQNVLFHILEGVIQNKGDSIREIAAE